MEWQIMNKLIDWVGVILLGILFAAMFVYGGF